MSNLWNRAMKEVRVTFLPQKAILDAHIGSNVLDIASEANLQIVSACNGRGVCGQCKVRVLDPLAVTQATEAEHFHLVADEIRRGYRLACQARLKGNVRIEILASKVSRYQFQVTGIVRKFKKNPAVKKYRVKLKKPTLKQPTSDDLLLLQSLLEQHKLTGLSYHPNVLRTLANTRSSDNIDIVVLGNEIIDVRNIANNLCGIAIDIGTTKIACYIVDLATGETLAADVIVNPQRAFGEDVVSRLTFEAKSEENWKTLQESLVQGINKMVESLSSKVGVSISDVYEAVVVGNTVMHHTFLGVHPVLVGRSPYSPTVGRSINVESKAVGLRLFENAKVHLAPNIAGFVGADCVAGILSTGLYRMKGLNLLVDIGTNTEISLGNSRFIYSCSCASGPAFEGYTITHGVPAIEGAIDRVQIDEKTYDVTYSTIGNVPPVGICGSGIIDSIAELLRTGIIDERGYFVNNIVTNRVRGQKREREFVVAAREESPRRMEITVKQNDVREVQLAKAAIYAGIQTLLRKIKVKAEKLDRIFVAGSFGSYINLPSAQAIGMLPHIPIERFIQVGNSAGAGAQQLLLSTKKRQVCERIARKTFYVELASELNFKNEYVRASYLPHKDPSEFPKGTRTISPER